MHTPRPAALVPFSTLFLLLACSDSPISPEAGSPTPEVVAVPNTATASLSAAPGGDTFVQVLTLVNPCTGQPDLVTITGIIWVLHDDRGTLVWRGQSSITTASGFHGRQTRTVVENKNIFKVSLNTMLADGAGARIRTRFVLLVDLATGTVRVQQAGGAVCLGA